jgi:NADH-quinone oxidoreductase subunit E
MKNKTVEKILLDFDIKDRNLLPALKKISAAFGYISQEQARKIANYFSLSLSQVYSVGTFYDEIKFEKPAEILIEICSSPACVVKNSLSLIREIENNFKIKLGEVNNAKVQFKTMSCLGKCAEGPILRINGKIYYQVDKAKLYEILDDYS